MFLVASMIVLLFVAPALVASAIILLPSVVAITEPLMSGVRWARRRLGGRRPDVHQAHTNRPAEVNAPGSGISKAYVVIDESF